MKQKTNKLPDFSKMSLADEAEWFDTHDLGDYWEQLKPIDLDVKLEHAKPKDETLVLRINKDVKKKLEQVAKDKGVTISAAARVLLTEKLRTI